MSTEHCQWDDWGPWKWDDQVEVDGKITKCGNGKRTRGEKTPAKYGGNACVGLGEESKFEACPGMNFIKTFVLYVMY